MMNDEHYMNLAIDQAVLAREIDEVPVGAVIVDKNGQVIGKGFNQPISACDTTSHAEINAIREACRNFRNYRLIDTVLYVTIEPCIMCMGAIIHSRIQKIVYGAEDPKWGAATSLYHMADDNRLNHQVDIVSGVCREEAKRLIKDFFKDKRSK